MYTILLNESNELIVSVRERIMQGSKLVDTLHFLIDPIYKGQDMSKFAVFMDYILPVSKQSCTELLPLSAELYKDRLEYKIPFDITLTAEEGDIKTWLTLVNSETDESGNTIKYIVREGSKEDNPAVQDLKKAAWYLDYYINDLEKQKEV